MDFCLGELRLKPKELETLTWADFDRLGRGYRRRLEEKRDRTRRIGHWLTGEDPRVLWPLSMDRQPPGPVAPTESFEERLARLKQLDPDKFLSDG